MRELFFALKSIQKAKEKVIKIVQLFSLNPLTNKGIRAIIVVQKSLEGA